MYSVLLQCEHVYLYTYVKHIH